MATLFPHDASELVLAWVKTKRRGGRTMNDDKRSTTEMDVLRELHISLACWRNCPVCDQKIDRGNIPPGQTRPDHEDLWPYWHCHAGDCDLRLAAQQLDLPTAVP